MTDSERHPLEISEEVARAEGVPEDLDATQREPYTIPSTRRRAFSGWVHIAGAGVAVAMVGAGLPAGLLVFAVGLALLGTWHLAAASRIEILDPEALEIANRATEFAVGHASAVVGFDGWLARPVWNVLVFSADDPPSRRGLVRIDARGGDVIETYTEDIVAT